MKGHDLISTNRHEWLDDAAALARFDSVALQWGKRTSVMVEDVPALRLLHQALLADREPEARRRLVALAFDIKIAYLNTSYHMYELAGSENRYLVHDEARTRFRPLEDVQSFGVALLRSRAAFGLVSRIRALWDKLFLYVTLRFDGDAGVRRLQARRSRRKHFFSEYGRGIGEISVNTMSVALADINVLEKDYRSPELHGFGVVPPWVFESPPTWPYGHTSPILRHWDVMRTFLQSAFAEADGKQCSLDAVPQHVP
jgi:hypothetical protein